MNWHQLGNNNTKFFHACANRRRRKNNIKEIKDNDGVIRNEQQEVERVIGNFFKHLFTSSNPPTAAIEHCLHHMDARVTPSMNEELQKPFVVAEIKEALKQMSPLKSPGPDGFGTCFYQAY